MRKECAIYKTVNIVGKRWTILILLELYKGENKWKRYSELKKSLLNITPKILSQRLLQLANEGFIKKNIDVRKSPIISKYKLTKKGERFIDIIKEMKKWCIFCNIKQKDCEKIDCKYCEF